MIQEVVAKDQITVYQSHPANRSHRGLRQLTAYN